MTSKSETDSRRSPASEQKTKNVDGGRRHSPKQDAEGNVPVLRGDCRSQIKRNTKFWKERRTTRAAVPHHKESSGLLRVQKTSHWLPDIKRGRKEPDQESFLLVPVDRRSQDTWGFSGKGSMNLEKVCHEAGGGGVTKLVIYSFRKCTPVGHF